MIKIKEKKDITRIVERNIRKVVRKFKKSGKNTATFGNFAIFTRKAIYILL